MQVESVQKVKKKMKVNMKYTESWKRCKLLIMNNKMFENFEN